MRIVAARVAVASVALALAACVGGSGATVPASGQAPPLSSSGLPPDLADAVEQQDGTYRLPDGRVFAAPEEFGIQPCDDRRWPVPDDTADLAAAAGVPVDPVEWLTHHVHASVRVFVDGTAEVVPAGIGIDNAGHRIAGLHTHDCSGTAHVEAEDETALTLGQFGDAWGVRIDGECFADLCAPDNTVAVQVNGAPVDDPRSVPISDCDEIVIVIGEAPDEIPPAPPEGC